MTKPTLHDSQYTLVIPAKNEAESLRSLLPKLRQKFPGSRILVIDDGSQDSTVEKCIENQVDVISHPYSLGNGAAVKTGLRNVTTDFTVLMDADGQHTPEDVRRLLDHLNGGYDMVVGARHPSMHASLFRRLANGLYNKLASLVTGSQIADLTSGLRVVDTHRMKQFIALLPNGFSYPTTLTMSFLRTGYSVLFVPVNVQKRIGKSHIHPLRDGFRFLIIILKIGTLYSPLKVFIPISLLFFTLGLLRYVYTFITFDAFTNMSALLFATSVLIFLIGLVSDQITNLVFSINSENSKSD